jgi:hypothetical protein
MAKKVGVERKRYRLRNEKEEVERKQMENYTEQVD